MSDAFQDIIMRLNRFWADQGCLVQEPYDVEVGAGTMAPATFLRVLGPEPWHVAYPQGCRRPADGRYAENPNRYQHYFQYQVILKPGPSDPQGLYLQSLEALGIPIRRHDVRFVEDNWESPALGAWGLGWEVWLDGLEITQFTYFQQAGGLDLNPPAVEITYGLERIAMYLQGVRDIAEIRWAGDPSADSGAVLSEAKEQAIRYGDLYRESEVQHCTYNFEQADVAMLTQLFDLYEAEARRIVGPALVVPALDYLLKCSHVFNLLDARGAVGVAQRAAYFRRMQALARRVASAYVARREELGFPLGDARQRDRQAAGGARHASPLPTGPADFVFEIGTEELPADDLNSAIKALRNGAPGALAAAGFGHGTVEALGTPRRLILQVFDLCQTETAHEETVKGPPARVAFDADGRPTKAAEGFARNAGVDVADLRVEQEAGREYVVATRRVEARPAEQALADVCLSLIRGLTFTRPMFWDEPSVAFSRPIRWLAPIWGEVVVPLAYAGLHADRVVRGPRQLGSSQLTIESAGGHLELLRQHEVEPEPALRREQIVRQTVELLEPSGARAALDETLLNEVANLVEWPCALVGEFDSDFLALPPEVLTTVMKKHQRYFPVLGRDGTLQPRFVAVASGRRGLDELNLIRHGNEEVLRARFADALFFWKHDQEQDPESFKQALRRISFQERLGSYEEKVERVRVLADVLVERWPDVVGAVSRMSLRKAAYLTKFDLATGLVRELPELQGIVGREYARRHGESPEIVQAIFEHYLPRFPGDDLPKGKLGVILGLADRIDTLANSFAAGLEPTGSSDPYSLRRTALGLLQLMLSRQIDLPLDEVLQHARLAASRPVADEKTLERVLTFLKQRLRVILLEEGLPHDAVDSALAALSSRPVAAAEVARAMSGMLGQPEFVAVVEALKRAARIQPKDGVHYRPDPEAIAHPAERALYETYEETKKAAKVVPLTDLPGFVRGLQLLVEPINSFFDELLVNDPVDRIRANRLGLLRAALDLAGERFDVSLLGGR